MNPESENPQAAQMGGLGGTCEQMLKSMPDLVVTASLQVFASNIFQNCRGYVATQALCALLASPGYNPARQEDGETTEQAYARRACDFADALLAALQKGAAKVAAGNIQPPTPNAE